ncbi:MAG TPA: gliding-motility protein MglA [Herpetosiphonaceae bacterium]|nr:gliding-motility protein MglA [Herpetosiphonaceae bacterium]
MATYDRKNRCFHCTLTYYGPSAGGKTSTLLGISEYFKAAGTLIREVHEETRPHVHIVKATVPGIGLIHGKPVQMHLQALAGATMYDHARLATLKDADGVVFVANSIRDMLQENIRHLQAVAREITRQKQRFTTFPLVLQYNKRDWPDALPTTVLDKYLNPFGWPAFETIACRRPQRDQPITTATIDALNALQELVLAKLNAT